MGKKMKLSKDGTDLIKRFEALRLHAYRCEAGRPTIGWGHITGVKMGDIIDEATAEAYLKEDCAFAVDAVNKIADLTELNQHQFDALVSFTFNVGASAFLNSTLRKKVLADPGDRSIADEFKKWKYCTVKGIKKVSKGLLSRRIQEADLYFSHDA